MRIEVESGGKDGQRRSASRNISHKMRVVQVVSPELFISHFGHVYRMAMEGLIAWCVLTHGVIPTVDLVTRPRSMGVLKTRVRVGVVPASRHSLPAFKCVCIYKRIGSKGLGMKVQGRAARI